MVSSPGKGALFTVRLPHGKIKGEVDRIRVLVVDDDTDVRKSLISTSSLSASLTIARLPAATPLSAS